MAKQPKQPEVGRTNPTGAIPPAPESSPQQIQNGRSQQAGENRRKRSNEYDPLIVNTIFPDAAAVFTEPPVSLKSVRGTACFVIDTSALLLPYEVSTASLVQVENSFTQLISDQRFFIPAQVAREVARQRANMISKLYQSLSHRRTQFQVNPIRPEKKAYPLLEKSAEYQRILAIEGEFGAIDQQVEKLAKEYRNKLGEAMEQIQSWEWDDPVSKLYARLFKKEFIISPPQSPEEISTAHNHRFIHDIPPGYKDRDEKDDGGIGDLLIWFTILDIGKTKGKSVIFVTGEKKADWWHLSERTALYPRYELLDEFRRYCGHSFHIIHLSDLLEQFGAKTDIVEEIRSKETVVDPKFVPTAARGPIAEMAVFKWLSSKYPLVERATRFDYCDFHALDDSDNAIIGVEVKVPSSMGGTRMLVEKYTHLLKKYADGARAGARSVQRYLLILVYESRSRANHACGRFMLDSPTLFPGGVSVLFGYVSADGTFVPSDRLLGINGMGHTGE